MNAGRLGLWLRTARYLRARQIAGQVRHRLLGGRAPRPWKGEPPRLAVATPVAPFLPAPPFAWSDGARRFRLRHREVGFEGAVDWDHADAGPLWAYDLHGFEWARRTTLAPGARRALVLDWIDRHPRGIGWSPHPTSLRTLAWTKLLATPGVLGAEGPERGAILASLGSQLEHLGANLETHLLANHYLSNLLALTIGGLALDAPRSKDWLANARALAEELAEQIPDDGLHVERSPMYHALLLETVLDGLNFSKSRRTAAPDGLDALFSDTASRMLGALAVLVHPDGGIALFADSGHGVAQEPSALAGYARALGVVARGPERAGLLADAGYLRLERGPFVLLASVAGPAPAYQPGHAHCDALAFELSFAGERIVTDTGVHEYIPGRLRDLARATRSHATLEVAGLEQAELWAAHRIGARPDVRLEAFEAHRRAQASCAGYATPDTRHVRVFELDEEALRIEDRLEGAPRRARFQLPLAPGLSPRVDGSHAEIRLESGDALRIELRGGPRLRVEDAPCFPEFGLRLERRVLVAEADPWPKTELVIAKSPVVAHIRRESR
ncbi:hypothetical protein MYXO_02896 [Myxococcaceae bacterium]|nr:hypothetical protein MYXO_02896 [Myxococcaceae bacterium]